MRLPRLAFTLSTLIVSLISVATPAQSGSALVGKQSPIAQQTDSPPGESSAGTSPIGLSSLPGTAQGPISAALGKDDSGYWVHRRVAGFRAENPQHALAADFTREGAEVRSHNLRWRLETRGYGFSQHPCKNAPSSPCHP